MGGDHKCPVCQATFTRPQHVARHMRSHTGDRPYKCQYCGDQFARSDLLSRHVNKCHANEKPLVNTAARRKGSASTSRATTSKQACDQCVQSSLPCDGSNPCTKCVQRKSRCTYVKFHRQTAPVGPGHNPRPATTSVQPPAVQGVGLGGGSSVSPTITSRYPLYSEEYASGTSGTSPSFAPQHQVSAAIHEALYPQSAPFSFGSMYPASASVDASTVEYAKYNRAHDDLYRPSTMPPGSASGSTSSSWAGNAAPIASGWPPPHQVSSSSQSHHQQDAYHQHQQHQHSAERHVYSEHQPHTLAPHQQHDDLPIYMRGGPGQHSGGVEPLTAPNFREIFAEDFAPRRGSISVSDHGYGAPASDTTDGSGSDGGGYYAASSSSSRGRKGYQDDMSGIDHHSPFSFDPHHERASSASSRGHSQHHVQPHHPYSDSSRPNSSSHPPPGSANSNASSSGGGSGGQIFNAFGSLSLNDPNNVLAGLAAAAAGATGGGGTDGSPFFANISMDQLTAAAAAAGVPFPPGAGGSAADPNTTPMPIKEEESVLGGMEGMRRVGEGERIQRPLSSPSVGAGLNWNNYLGLGGGGGAGTGWTPGGVFSNSGYGEPSDAATSSSSSSVGLGLGLGGVGNGITPGKDMDPKELKEFWKQYLRTPMTTADHAMGEDVDRSSGGAGVASPMRRPRVVSMPSSKTPMGLERDRMYGATGSNFHYQPQGQGQPQQQQQGQPNLGPMSSLRTTLNSDNPSARSQGKAKEDLTSYEQAVMARKTPMNLNMGRLTTRRRGNTGASVPGPSGTMPPNMLGEKGGNVAREMMMHHQHQRSANTTTSMGSDESTSGSAGASPASRASSLGLEADSRPGSRSGMNGIQQTTMMLQRPSAKRLASSVLESGVSKAMKYDMDVSEGSGTIAIPPHPLSMAAPQVLGSVNSLPPISTGDLDPYRQQQQHQQNTSGDAMMAPPPPNSAPPQAGSVLNYNIPRAGGSTLAERRRMSVASMMSDGSAAGRNRSMSAAR